MPGGNQKMNGLRAAGGVIKKHGKKNSAGFSGNSKSFFLPFFEAPSSAVFFSIAVRESLGRGACMGNVTIFGHMRESGCLCC